MRLPLLQPGIKQLKATLQIYDLHLHSLLQLLSIALFEGGAGKHNISTFSRLLLNEIVDSPHPRAAIGVVEGNTAAHLLFIQGRVEIVSIDKHPAQGLSEQLSNACLA